MQHFYYPRAVRRVLIGFLDFFNKIKVYNYDTSGTVSNIIDVALKYGPGEKYHLFNLQTEANKKYYVKLPAILVSVENLSYNSSRATSVNETRSFFNNVIEDNTPDDFWEDVIPTPYDITFKVEIKTESMDHLFQIIENINPYFNPSNHLRLKEFDFLNLERNIRVSLQSSSMEYPSQMGEDESRYFNATLTFLAEAFLYRPIDEGKIIKFIKTRYIYSPTNSETFSTSGLPSSATAPSDYNYWRFLDG